MEAVGAEMLLKVSIGAEPIGVAGLLVNAFVVNHEPIDITNKGHTWRTLLEGGKATVDIDADMIALDDAVQAFLREASRNGTAVTCEIVDAVGDGISGSFLVGSYDHDGQYDGSETASIKLHSLRVLNSGAAKVVNPIISPSGGVVTSSQSISISCDTSGATIYYTTDGSTPTISSQVYTGPFTLTASTLGAEEIVNGAFTTPLGPEWTSSVAWTRTTTIVTPPSGQQAIFPTSKADSGATIVSIQQELNISGQRKTQTTIQWGTWILNNDQCGIEIDAFNGLTYSNLYTLPSQSTNPGLSVNGNANWATNVQQLTLPSGTQKLRVRLIARKVTGPGTDFDSYFTKASVRHYTPRVVRAFAVKSGMIDSGEAAETFTVT